MPDEEEIRSIAREEARQVMEVRDENGNSVSVTDFTNFGLTRRQALHAMALVAGGASIGGAVANVMSDDAVASHGGGQIGTANNPLDAVYVNDLLATSVGTSSNPVTDVHSDNVTANTKIVDAAGVEHTGELADLSDVGSGSTATGVEREYSLRNWHNFAPNTDIRDYSKLSDSVIGPGSSGSWDDNRASNPGVAVVDGTIHILYTGADSSSGERRIGHATAPVSDPSNVTKDADNPIITPTQGWENTEVQKANPVVIGGTVYIAYASSREIGVASAPVDDWSDITKNPNNPIFTAPSSGFGSTGVSVPCLLKEGETWHLFFEGDDNGIGHAYGDDIGNLSTDSSNPVVPAGSVEVTKPSVGEIGDKWYMMNRDGDNIDLQYNDTLMGNWTESPDNPIITPTEAWENNYASNPSWFRDGTDIHVYYVATPGGTSEVALATLDASPPTTYITGGYGSNAPNSLDTNNLLHRYDATQLSVSDGSEVTNFTDSQGSTDLGIGAGSPTFRSSIQNGNGVVRYDGSSGHSGALPTTESQPNHIFVVFSFNNAPSDSDYVIGAQTQAQQNSFNSVGSSDFNMTAGNGLSASGTFDQNWHVVSLLFNGTSSEMRIDETTVVTGDAGTNSLDSLSLGWLDWNSGNYATADIGEVAIYNTDKSSNISNIEGYLRNKWGI